MFAWNPLSVLQGQRPGLNGYREMRMQNLARRIRQIQIQFDGLTRLRQGRCCGERKVQNNSIRKQGIHHKRKMAGASVPLTRPFFLTDNYRLQVHGVPTRAGRPQVLTLV